MEEGLPVHSGRRHDGGTRVYRVSYVLSLVDSASIHLYLVVSETMDIINVKYARSHAGMRVTSSATPSCEDILGDRIEVSLVDTCRDAPSTGRLSNDENEHEHSYEGGVGGTDGTGVRGQGERNTLLHSKVDEISAPAERRSAGKLTKGECARGSLSLSLSPPLPSPLSLFLPPTPCRKSTPVPLLLPAGHSKPSID